MGLDLNFKIFLKFKFFLYIITVNQALLKGEPMKATFETFTDFCKLSFSVLYIDQKEKFVDISNWDHKIDKNKALEKTGYNINIAAQYVYNKIRFNWRGGPGTWK
jgi:hypothetical protein